jgi:hypothetical protein
MKRLPRLLTAEVENLSYADAVRLIYLFKNGIRNRKFFQLDNLKPATIRGKQRADYVAPTHPLFGDSYKKERFNNMMEITKENTRWIVRPKNKDHFKAKIPLSVLFDVHEYGATIQRGAITIRIPPRPAFRYAYNVLVREKEKNDPAEKLRERIAKYINTGEWTATKRIVLKDTDNGGEV